MKKINGKWYYWYGKGDEWSRYGKGDEWLPSLARPECKDGLKEFLRDGKPLTEAEYFAELL